MEGAASSSEAGRGPRGGGLPVSGLPAGGLPGGGLASGGMPGGGRPGGAIPVGSLTAGGLVLPGSGAAAPDPAMVLPGLGLGQPPSRSRVTLLVRRAGRRLPPRTRQALRSLDRRSRVVAARMRRRWHRSLQLRVAATTLVICVVVVTVLGFFLVQQIESGLLNSARTSGSHQLAEGLTVARDDTGLAGSPGDRVKALLSLASTLQGLSGPGDNFDVVIFAQPSGDSAFAG